MFLFQLWDGVWYVGDETDFWVYLIIQFLLVTALIALTVMLIVPTLAWMGVRQLVEQRAVASFAAAVESGTYVLPPPDPCPTCGNTESRDIAPCIKCGY